MQKEFEGIRVLFDEYRESLRKVYKTPDVPELK